MKIDFNGKWMGFNIYTSPAKQETVFRKIIYILKKLNWEEEGFYFNYYKDHARMGLRINPNKINTICEDIKSEFKTFGLIEKQEVDNNLTDYWIYFPANETGGEYDNTPKDSSNKEELIKQKKILKLKEIGTKCAILFKETLKIGSPPYDHELWAIAGALHFLMNPLVHNYAGYETEIDVYYRALKKAEEKLKVK